MSAAPLRFFGNTNVIEISPVVIALQRCAPLPVTVEWGGIWHISEGRADVATNGETQLLRFSAQDPDLRVILTVAEDAYRLAARKASGIDSIASLRGKRITTPLDTTAHWFVIELLRSAGLSERDVELMQIEPWKDQVAALACGDVDAMAMWEPDPELARELMGQDIVFLKGEAGGYRELFNLYTSTRILDDCTKRAQIVSFVAAILEASESLTLEPSAYFPLIAASTGWTRSQVTSAWDDFSFPGHLADNLLDVLEHQEVWVAERQRRHARPRAELSKLICGDIHREAVTEVRARRNK